MEKIKVYIDADDTILDSSVAIIDILNKKNNTNKTIHNLRDWNYRDIDGTMNGDKILELYESEEFFNTVKVKENVKDLDDVPQEVKDAVTFIPCSNVSQVLHNALVK